MAVKVKWHPQRFNSKLDRDIDRRLNRSTNRFARFIQNNFGTRGYPGIDTGRLKNSIKAVKIKKHEYGIGTNVSYAKAVEFGTFKMFPRPFLRNSLISWKGFWRSFWRR